MQSSSTLPTSSSSSNSVTSLTNPPRRRNSIIAAVNANPLTNTTVNPLASWLSSVPHRLPTTVVVPPTVSAVTGRRSGATGTATGTDRRTGAISGGTGVVDTGGGGGGGNSIATAGGGGGVVVRSHDASMIDWFGETADHHHQDDVSSSSGNISRGDAANTSSTRRWNNLSSMVQSISPILPNSMVFQRAARRITGSVQIQITITDFQITCYNEALYFPYKIIFTCIEKCKFVTFSLSFILKLMITLLLQSF